MGFLYQTYKIMFAAALFVLFGPLSFYLGRLEESVLAGLLVFGSLLSAITAAGIDSRHRLHYLLLFVCIPLLFYVDLLRHQSPYNSIAFLFPMIEWVLFFLAGSYWMSRRIDLLALVSGFVAIKALLILYKYASGQFFDLALEFSDVSAVITVGGIVLQRPFDAAISLFGIISFYAAVTESRWRRTYYSVITLLCVVIAIISFARSLWLAMLVAFIAIVVNEGSRRLILTSISITIAAVMLLALGLRGPLDPYADLLYQRIDSTSEQTDSNLGNLRIYEMQDTSASLMKGSAMQLLIGIGPAGTIATYERDGADITHVDKQYIHNYHALMLAKLGLILFSAIYIPVLLSMRRGGAYSYFLLGLGVFLLFQPVVLAFHLFALAGAATWLGRKSI